jgi:nucleoid-associated protein YgaU
MIKLILIALAIATTSAFAQMAPDSKPDAELTKKEAELRIIDWENKIKDLEARLAKAKSNNEDVKTQLANAQKNLKDCRDAYAALVGASEADINKFREDLGRLEGRVREYKKLTNDELADKRTEIEQLQADYFTFRNNKIAALEEFYSRVVSLGVDINGLFREKETKTYTVGTWAENKDCLWNIAGRTEIFGDPFLWPKIWQQNKDIIRNPDLIYQGQVFTLPKKAEKTSDEQKAERKYWRNKRAAQEKAKEANSAKTGN